MTLIVFHNICNHNVSLNYYLKTEKQLINNDRSNALMLNFVIHKKPGVST